MFLASLPHYRQMKRLSYNLKSANSKRSDVPLKFSLIHPVSPNHVTSISFRTGPHEMRKQSMAVSDSDNNVLSQVVWHIICTMNVEVLRSRVLSGCRNEALLRTWNAWPLRHHQLLTHLRLGKWHTNTTTNNSFTTAQLRWTVDTGREMRRLNIEIAPMV